MRSQPTADARIVVVVALLALSAPSALAVPPDTATQSLLAAFRYDEQLNSLVVDMEAARGALDAGANPNYVSDTRRPSSVLDRILLLCVHDAADHPEASDRIVSALRLLVARGARLQYVDAGILFFPLSGGYTEVVRFLLDQGASATFWPPELGTPLSPLEYGTQKGFQDIAALLVQRGARPLAPDVAAQLRLVGAAEDGNIPEMEALLESGARVNAKTRGNQTALLASVDRFMDGYDYFLTITYLLDRGADVNIRGEGNLGSDVTPLHGLAWISALVERAPDRWAYAERLLQLFLANGALISAVDGSGKTALHYAAEYNGLATASVLLEHGAKVMPRDRQGKTPLDYAEGGELIRLLKSNGATEQ